VVGLRASCVDYGVVAGGYEFLESQDSGSSVLVAMDGGVEIEAGVADVQLPGWGRAAVSFLLNLNFHVKTRTGDRDSFGP
jgi:hypothetical protein